MEALMLSGCFTCTANGHEMAGILFVITLITNYKVFEKYGIPGWKGLVPFYNLFLETEKVWSRTAAVEITALTVGCFFLGSIISYCFGGGAAIALMFVIAVMDAILCYKKSRAFGFNLIMTAGLIFLPFLSNMVIGFGQAKYRAPHAADGKTVGAAIA